MLETLSRRGSRTYSRPPLATARLPLTVSLRVEALEDRTAPATYMVNSLGDQPDNNPGDGVAQIAVPPPGEPPVITLRAALMELNATAGSHSITFSPAVQGEIGLTAALPALSRDIDIVGPGWDKLTLRRIAAADFRIFEVAGDTTCTISGLSITGGNLTGADDGAGIFNDGTLDLYGLHIYDNSTEANGGGIYNGIDGVLTVSDCSILDNVAAVSGGGIINHGQATIQYNSSIIGNQTAGNGGGIANSDSGTCWVADESDIIANSAAGRGGGVSNGGIFSMSSGLLENNDAVHEGGGIYSSADVGEGAWLYGVSVRWNSADKGGGFYLEAGELLLDTCILSNNTGRIKGAGGCHKPAPVSNLTIINPVAITDAIVLD